MQERNTEAIRSAERIVMRTEAISGAAVAIAAAMDRDLITGEQVLQMLDIIARDIRAESTALLQRLTAGDAAG